MAKFVQTTLIDGYAGGPHVTEVQLGLAHQATFGPDDYVLEGGRESEAQVLTNNSIRIFDAVYCIQGRRDVIPASGYTDVTIANGTQGMNRNDIIVRRYKKNESSEIESTEYAVIKGTPNAGAAVDPEVTTGDIRSGATLHEMALYRVKITGLNITAVEPMFNILKNMASLQKELTELNSKTSYKFDSLSWTNPTYHITKKSGIIYIDYHCVVSGGVPGVSYLVAKLPSSIYPKNTIKSQAWTANGSSQRHGASIEIKPNGQICLVAGDSFVEAGFTVSYPL